MQYQKDTYSLTRYIHNIYIYIHIYIILYTYIHIYISNVSQCYSLVLIHYRLLTYGIQPAEVHREARAVPQCGDAATPKREPVGFMGYSVSPSIPSKNHWWQFLVFSQLIFVLALCCMV